MQAIDACCAYVTDLLFDDSRFDNLLREGGVRPVESVDETDERILAELADNARATFAEIG